MSNRLVNASVARSTIWTAALFCSSVGVGCSSSGSNATPDASSPANDASGDDVQSGMDASVSTSPDSGLVALDSGRLSDGGTATDAEAGAVPSANLLISDQYNNRVIELDRTTNPPRIVWTFGDGNSAPGPHSVVAPNDAERLLNGQTLISGTGTGAGTEPACPMDGGGCPDNRVLLVGADGGISWVYGENGELSSPVCSVQLPGVDGGPGNVLITDQGHTRVIEVTASKTIAWRFPPEGPDGSTLGLNNPNSAERLPNGNTLIADENNDRVIEVDATPKIVWEYPSAHDSTLLSGAAFASRLDNGNTLITDSNNNRILEVSQGKAVVWAYSTAARALLSADGGAPAPRDGGSATPNPTRAVRLKNGDTLISDQLNHQVIEVNAAGQTVFSYGQLNTSGVGPNMLNGPYDAKLIGDFTGLTKPSLP